jgi:hypothetical protein
MANEGLAYRSITSSTGAESPCLLSLTGALMTSLEVLICDERASAGGSR